MDDGMKLYAYVILENHLHFIAQSDSIARDVSRFKSFTARQITHTVGSVYLARGFIPGLQGRHANHRKKFTAPYINT